MFQLDTSLYDKISQNQNNERDYALKQQAIATQQETNKQAAELNNLKISQAKIERATQVLNTATPETWAQARAQAIAGGMGTEATIPAQYDPAWVERTNYALADANSKLAYKAKQFENTITDMSGNPIGGASSAPVAFAPVDNGLASRLGGAAAGDQPLSVRNNNPGNMRDPKTGNFQQFATPEAGTAAMQNDLSLKIGGRSPIMKERYGENYVPTIANLISTWAPESENNTAAYIHYITQNTGIPADRPLTQDDIKYIMPHIAKMEGGEKAASHFANLAPAGKQAVITPMAQTTTATKLSDPIPPAQQPAQSNLTFLMKGGKPYTDNLPQGQQWARDEKGNMVAGKIPGAGTTEDNFKNENTLRDEYNAVTKDFRTVQDAFSKIRKTSATGAGDMSMLYAYVKLLDPGSVVRESEFATAAASGSLGERMQGWVKSVTEGGRLPPEQRKEFLAEAKRIYEGQKAGYDRIKGQYTGMAQRNKLNPENVVWDYTDNTPDDPNEMASLSPEAAPVYDMKSSDGTAYRVLK